MIVNDKNNCANFNSLSWKTRFWPACSIHSLVPWKCSVMWEDGVVSLEKVARGWNHGKEHFQPPIASLDPSWDLSISNPHGSNQFNCQVLPFIPRDLDVELKGYHYAAKSFELVIALGNPSTVHGQKFSQNGHYTAPNELKFWEWTTPDYCRTLSSYLKVHIFKHFNTHRIPDDTSKSMRGAPGSALY